MCCRRRQNAPYGAQRHHNGPMIAVLGKMAYDKYQERKARNIAATESEAMTLPAPEMKSSPLSEKTDVQPPSYEELVVNRAIVPEKHVDVENKDIDLTALREVVDETAQSLDADRGYGVANGMNYSGLPMNGQACQRGGCGGHGRCQQGCGGRCGHGCGGRCQRGCGMGNTMHHPPVPMNAEPCYTGGCQSRCQQKKAARAARKAEKEAAKWVKREVRT